MADYDVIVLGIGGVGSAALLQLARRRVRALGIERFSVAHDRGSSHGATRLIRKAYFEHPNYVPLVLRAFEQWEELERATGSTLFHQVGLLQIGPADGEVLRGVRESARQYGLPVENFSARDAMNRFVGLVIPETCEAVFEQQAGYLMVERCVEANVKQALGLGATLHTGEEVRGWRAEDSGVAVETDRATYSADRLVVAAGAWSSALLAGLNIPLEVRRKPLYWFEARGETYRAERGCPAFFYELPEGCFYGFPQIDSAGIKVAQHSGGPSVADPLTVDRELDEPDMQRVARFVARFLPQASGNCTDHTVCMYTMTPDEHFVVDRHPQHPQVVFAAGLSGHGFKFTCVLGEALADLALEGRTDLPIGFLSATRPALAAR